MRRRVPSRFAGRLLAATALVAVPATAVAQEGPAVVASIGPIHSLVAAVMDGVGEPYLLVPGGASPHTYALRPSDAAALESADAVFWAGEAIETFLDGPLDSLAADHGVVALMHAEGVRLLQIRAGGIWDEHDHDHGHDHGHDDHGHGEDHDDHDHDEHDDHDHDDHDHDHDDHDHDHEHDDHEHGDHAEHDDHDHDHDEHDHDDHDEHADHHDHGEHDGHDTHSVDGHLWLDPLNAVAMVDVIERHLGEVAPPHAAQFAANADALRDRLDTLHHELEATLAPVSDTPYVVFHDAYQYFETRYGLAGAGSITLSPDIQPGAQRLAEIRERLSADDVACVFSEPQFEPRLVNVVVEGTDVRIGTLDPLGADIPPGPDAYFVLMRGLADALAGCLAEAG